MERLGSGAACGRCDHVVLISEARTPVGSTPTARQSTRWPNNSQPTWYTTPGSAGESPVVIQIRLVSGDSSNRLPSPHLQNT